jgi:hypothetical protein
MPPVTVILGCMRKMFSVMSEKVYKHMFVTLEQKLSILDLLKLQTLKLEIY